MADESERATLRQLIQDHHIRKMRHLLSRHEEFPPRSDLSTIDVTAFLLEAYKRGGEKIDRLKGEYERVEKLREDVMAKKLITYPGISIVSNLAFTILIRKRLSQKVSALYLGSVLVTTFILLPLTFVHPIARMLSRNHLREISDILAQQRALFGQDPELQAMYASAAQALSSPQPLKE